VLGFYFPWFERETWSDPQMLGRPLRAYSADDAADVLQGMRDASRAGLDGVIVSFQGKETGWNHRRMLLVLQAAQQSGLRVSADRDACRAPAGSSRSAAQRHAHGLADRHRRSLRIASRITPRRRTAGGVSLRAAGRERGDMA
jgi:hypothetical protein